MIEAWRAAQLSAIAELRICPQRSPSFRLRGAHPAAAARLPLNVFEPRYLAMVDEVLAGERLIGIVQPAPEAGARNRRAARSSAASRRLRRAPHVLHRDRRRPLSHLADRHRPLRARRGDRGYRQAVPVVRGRTSRITLPTSSPATARTRSTAPRLLATLQELSRAPTISTPTGTASTTPATSGWSTRCRS